MTIRRGDGDQHRWHSADRDAYTGVRASWYDPRAAKQKEVQVDAPDSGKKGEILAGIGDAVKKLKDVFASEADATAAAKAEQGRIERGKATFELTLAEGRPDLMPQATVTVAGFKPEIDSSEWRIVKCTHSVSDGGYTTRIELELAA